VEHHTEEKKQKLRQSQLKSYQNGWITFRVNKESLKILSQQKIFVLTGGM
jgi:hypothetical protein